MKITYDEQADAVYIYLNKKPIAHTKEVEQGIVVDLAKDGAFIGLEILFASKKIGKKSIHDILERQKVVI